MKLLDTYSQNVTEEFSISEVTDLNTNLRSNKNRADLNLFFKDYLHRHLQSCLMAFVSCAAGRFLKQLLFQQQKETLKISQKRLFLKLWSNP